MADGIISKIQLPDNTIYDVVDNTSGYMTGMTILSYGSSTWQNFIDAYNSSKVVYCRASSNANPASGSQTRLAFMAYVNNATTPTNVEFQYYRSVSTHTASQQGDQVYVYKLDKTAGWSVTTREASVKVVAGTGLGGTYSNGTMTLTGPTKVSDLTNDSGFITTSDLSNYVQNSYGEYVSNYITTDDGEYGAAIVASNSLTSKMAKIYWSALAGQDNEETSIIFDAENILVGDYDYTPTSVRSIVTKEYVDDIVDNLPEPMLFKGSVGTNGTVTWANLATAAASNEGFTYKVITDHTAETGKPAARVGDTIISNGSEWIVIPSGDEPSGTVTSVGLSNATNGGLTISNSPITSSGNITVGHSNVLSSAQTTQAVYPIKIDKNGHISEYGSAVTIPTVPTAAEIYAELPSAVAVALDTEFGRDYEYAPLATIIEDLGVLGYENPQFSGTVTSVGLTNNTNGGLTISGSPITSSGSITVGHSNVLASAQTTQAVYPITIDKNGHISSYGNAITVHEVPSGGTTGQVLAKNSNTNYDVGWITLPDNGAFYVTFTYDDVNDSWSCDKTAQQIYEAYIVHKTILAKENVRNSLYYLDFIDYDGQEDYYSIKFTTQTGAESAQDGVYIYNSVFYYTSDDGILQEDYSNDIINGVSDVKINNYSVVRNGIAYIPDMSNFVENFSSGDITSSIRPWVEGGFGYIRYRDQSFNEDHVATIDYGVQRESNVSYSQISLGADKIDLNGRTSFYNDNNSNYCVYLDVPTGLANAVAITLPSNNGTLALTSDLHNIPSGGTSGQVLTKHSATNYDVEWADASIGAYIVTFTYDESEDVYTCDKTSQEIYEACMSGKNIVGVCYYGDPITDGDIYDCKNVSKELEGGIYYYYAQFSSVSFEGGHAGSQILFVSNSGVRNDSDFMYPVPDNRKINNKPLSSDITLTASDVGALPDTTTIPSKTSDLTNDSGFITGYTETDPTVPAWAKASTKPSYNASEINGAMRVDGSYGNPPYSYGVYGLGSTATQIPVYYSTQNITDSNQVTTKGYVDNAISGKIDTAGTGLSKSGTTLNHSNSITAQTTSGIYPIKIDAQGHITEYGNAVTIPTITLNGSSTTSPSFYAPTGAGTSGYVLTSNGSGAPSWSNPTAAQIIRWAEST